MPGIKKCFSLFLAGIFLFSSSNVFAETGNTILYDKNYSKNIVSEIPKDGTQIIIKSEKDNFKKGESFSVDFEILNNPGFSSYGFKVEYDGTVIEPVSASSEKCQVQYSYNSKVKNKAIENEGIENAVRNKKENDFYVTGFCMSGSGELAKTTGDGLLFSVKFKAIGDGKSMIDLSGSNDFILSDPNDVKIPVYVKNFIITSGDSDAVKDSNIEETTKSVGKLSDIKNLKENNENSTEATSNEVYSESESQSESGTVEETYPDFEINVPTALAEPVQFKDMGNHPWAKDVVSFLSSLGVVKGVGWRIFNPSGFTTRADFMIIVKRFTGIEGEPKLNVYTDIDNAAYYAEAVGVITRYGLAKGITDEQFRPKENITRQEVIVILARILEKVGKLKKSDLSILDSFVDEDFVSPYAREYMADMVGMGIVKGNDKKKLNPVEPITRAEVCVLVKSVYDLIK